MMEWSQRDGYHLEQELLVSAMSLKQVELHQPARCKWKWYFWGYCSWRCWQESDPPWNYHSSWGFWVGRVDQVLVAVHLESHCLRGPAVWGRRGWPSEVISGQPICLEGDTKQPPLAGGDCRWLPAICRSGGMHSTRLKLGEDQRLSPA